MSKRNHYSIHICDNRTMEQRTKRARSANLTFSERCLLLDLVEAHAEILENKQTDAMTIARKSHAWSVLTDQFNARSGLPSRARENLKYAWENLKRMARRLMAEDDARRYTGGFAKNTEKDTILERIFSLIQTTNQNSSSNVRVKMDPSVVVGMMQGHEDVYEEEAADDSELLENADRVDEVTQDLEYWSNYPPPSLYKPPSQALRVQEALENGQSQDNVVSSNQSKPWPGGNQSEPSRFEENSSSLVKAKIEAIEKHSVLEAQEREEAKELNKIKLEIEKEKLKQEKIKTRLLLLELRKSKNNFVKS